MSTAKGTFPRGCPTDYHYPGMKLRQFDQECRHLAEPGRSSLPLLNTYTHTCGSESYDPAPENAHHGEGTGMPLTGGGNSKGVFGRFQYLPANDYIFVLLNDYDQPAYLLCRKAACRNKFAHLERFSGSRHQHTTS